MGRRLEEHLVARGLLTPERAVEVLRTQALLGGALDTILLDQRAVGEQELLTALGEVSGVFPIHLPDFEPNQALAREVPAALAERMGIVPLSMEGATLHVATCFPVDGEAIAAFATQLGRPVVPWVAIAARLRDWMSILFGIPIPAREATVLAALDPQRPLPPPEKDADGEALLEELTLEELLEREMVEPISLDVRKASVSGQLAGNVEPVVEWTLVEARAALKAVTGDREAMRDVTLRFALRSFDYAAAFAVIQGTAVGWAARARGAVPGQVGRVSIPLDAPSVFRTVALSRGSYAGPVPLDALTRSALLQLGRAPRAICVVPVDVKGRLVALFYGDAGARPISQRRLTEFLLFCQELSPAFAELLLLRKQRQIRERPPESEASAWTPGAVNPLTGRSRGPPAPADGVPELAPADLAPILERILGADPAQRATAMADLASFPDAASRALVERFPGPTAWSRRPVQELPDADELGPIPGALVRLGRPAAQVLVPRLDADSTDTRYFAILTAGGLPFAELVPGVLRGLFDLEPDLSSAARVTARAFRHVPRFQAALPSLRQELAARDSTRRALAARALGALHDREAIEGLINLTGSDDTLCAQCAAEALAEITRASFGTLTRAWTSWWADNRLKRRSQWLYAALRNPDLAQRTAAAEELAAALGETLGYLPDAPPALREAAVQRWESALLDARLRVVD